MMSAHGVESSKSLVFHTVSATPTAVSRWTVVSKIGRIRESRRLHPTRFLTTSHRIHRLSRIHNYVDPAAFSSSSSPQTVIGHPEGHWNDCWGEPKTSKRHLLSFIADIILSNLAKCARVVSTYGLNPLLTLLCHDKTHLRHTVPIIYGSIVRIPHPGHRLN
jgi:hypothetical protein